MPSEASGATGPIARFDDLVDGLFDHLRGKPAVDRIMYTTTELADFSLLWHLVGVARALRSPRDEQAALRLSAALGLESALVNVVLKSLVKRERPVAQFERPLNLRVPLTTSFPSGHASAAFCAATLLADGDDLAPLYYLLATVTATSRIHVRIHHASDVLVGAAIGLTLGRVIRSRWPLRAR
jgi:undecaprenyl-diphosphatase